MIADCADGDSSRKWYDTLVDIRNLSTCRTAYPDMTARASRRRRWPWTFSTRRSRPRPGRPGDERAGKPKTHRAATYLSGLHPALSYRRDPRAPTFHLMSELGLILAFGSAAFSGVALLCKHRGAVAAPDVAMRRPLRSATGLFRSRWWLIGFGLAFLAWCLYLAALSMAPLSVVQTAIAGGLALLAFPARRWFGLAVCRRELIGLVLCASGLGVPGADRGPWPRGRRLHRFDDDGVRGWRAGSRWLPDARLGP